MKRFEGKKVVITGAASGVGLATAERIAEEGGTLALMDINADGVKKAADDVTKRFGVKALAYGLDVTRDRKSVV